MTNDILYYPTIEFNDFDWLWRASLIYDHIYRIVPEGYTLNEPRNVEVLCSSGDIGRIIRPGAYATEVGTEFMNNINSGHWDAAGLNFQSNEIDQALLHEDKCDVALRNMIIAQGSAPDADGFLPVSKYFAATYMSFLARKMAEKNGLQVATDSLHAFTASVYFQYDGNSASPMYAEDAEQHIAAILINDFLPQNALQIRPEEIIKFRDRFREERLNFIQSINNAAAEISACVDPSIVEQKIMDLRNDVRRKTDDLKDALRFLNVKEFAGMKTITAPIATGLFPKVFETMANYPDLKHFLIASGVALGAYIGTKEVKRKRSELSKSSDFSYLLHMENSFPDASSALASSFHEFIED